MLQRLAIPLVTLVFAFQTPLVPAGDRFRRGDANADGAFDISDPVRTLIALYAAGPGLDCFDSADSNDDGRLDLSDAVYSLATLFQGGPDAPAPRAWCGLDPTADTLDCAAFGVCPLDEPALVESVVVAAPGTLAMAEVSEDSIWLPALVPGLCAGSVLVSGDGEGLLRRIESVEPSAGGYFARTSPATLEDVFQEADVSMDEEIGYEDLISFAPAVEGVTVEPDDGDGQDGARGGEEAGDGGGGAIAFRHKVRMKMAATFKPMEGVTIGATGSLTLSLGARVDLRVGLNAAGVPQLQSFLFEPSSYAKAAVTFKIQGKHQFADWKQLVGTFVGAPITVPAGPVPVVFTPSIDCYLKFSASGEATAVLEPSASLRTRARIAYSAPAGWTATQDPASPAFGFKYQISGKLEAVQAFAIEGSLALYGVAGPYVRLEAPYLKETAQFQVNPPEWKLSVCAGVKGSIGAKVSVLGKTVVATPPLELFGACISVPTDGGPGEPAGNAESWNASHDDAGAGGGFASGVAVDADGSVFAAGLVSGAAIHSDLLIVKYAKDGKQLWEQRIAGESANSLFFMESVALVLDPQGNPCIAALLSNPLGDSHLLRDVIVAKLSSAGAVLWSRVWSPGFAAYLKSLPLRVDAEGNLWISRLAEPATGGWQAYVTKLGPDGSELWSSELGMVATDISVDASGNALVGGSSLYRFDRNGNRIWGPITNGSLPSVIAQDSRGNAYAAYVPARMDQQERIDVEKRDAAGNLLWRTVYAFPGDVLTWYAPQLSRLKLDEAGDVWIVGTVSNESVTWGRPETVTMRLGVDGNILWTDLRASKWWTPEVGLELDAAGNAYVADDSNVFSLSPAGETRWILGPDDPDAWVDFLGGITLDTSGRVYVAGMSVIAEDSASFAVAKLPAR